MAEYDIDSVNIEVTAETKQAEEGLKRLSNVLERIKKTASEIKMPKISISSDVASGAQKSLQGATQAARDLDKEFRAVLADASRADEILDSVMSKTRGVSDASVFSNDFGIRASEHAGQSTQYGNILGDSGDEAAGAAPKFERLKSVLSGIASSFKGIGKAGISAFKGIAGLVKSGINKAFDKPKQNLKDINNKLKYFKGVLRNVLTFSAFYNILRAINEAFKVGTDNLYQYSKALSGTFAQSMDSLSASLQYFRNSIGAAVAPIINLLAPAIEVATDAIVEMINAVNQMLASLTGASSWTKAVRVPKEYAEAAEEATKSNKNLLAGFDELNVIQSKTDSGSSADAVDYSSMFEEVSLENYTLPDFVERIKNSILGGDWAGAARILAEKINSFFSGINWGDIGSELAGGLQGVIDTYNSFMETLNFEGVGGGIAESLNNLIYGLDFTSLGEAFAQKFNALFDLVYGFVTNFDWSEFGVSISNGINGFFDKIDWQRLGKTINATVLGILTTLYEAVTNTDWKQIGVNIGTAINQIDWSDILGKFTATLTKAMQIIPQAITGFLQGIDWQNFGSELWDSLVAIVTSIDYNGLVTTVFELAGSIAGVAVGLAEGFFKKLWESIKQAWESLKSYFAPYISEAGGSIFEGILQGIVDAVKNIGTWIYDNIFKPFIDGFKKAFGIASPSKEMMTMGQYIVDGLLEGLRNTWSKITGWVTNSFNWIKTTITNAFNEVKTTVSNIWDGIWNTIKSVINTILGGIQSMVNGVIRGFNSMIKALNKLSFDVPDWVPGIGGEKFGFNIKTISEVSIPRLASGGFVDSAQLFMARENGMTEYVGSMGNRAAVANNDQIVEGIASGVSAANSEQNALLREQNALLRQLLAKETNVTLSPSAQLGRVNAKSQQMYAAMTGG